MLSLFVRCIRYCKQSFCIPGQQSCLDLYHGELSVSEAQQEGCKIVKCSDIQLQNLLFGCLFAQALFGFNKSGDLKPVTYKSRLFGCHLTYKSPFHVKVGDL